MRLIRLVVLVFIGTVVILSIAVYYKSKVGLSVSPEIYGVIAKTELDEENFTIELLNEEGVLRSLSPDNAGEFYFSPTIRKQWVFGTRSWHSELIVRYLGKKVAVGDFVMFNWDTAPLRTSVVFLSVVISDASGEASLTQHNISGHNRRDIGSSEMSMLARQYFRDTVMVQRAGSEHGETHEAGRSR